MVKKGARLKRAAKNKPGKCRSPMLAMRKKRKTRTRIRMEERRKRRWKNQGKIREQQKPLAKRGRRTRNISGRNGQEWK